MAEAAASSSPAYTAKEVAAHNTPDDCWMVIQGKGMFNNTLLESSPH